MNIGQQSEAIYVEPIEMPDADQVKAVETEEKVLVPVKARKAEREVVTTA